MLNDIETLLAELGATAADRVLVSMASGDKRAVFVSYNPEAKTYEAAIFAADGSRTVIASGTWPVTKPGKKPK